jgi:hypothetical protein
LLQATTTVTSIAAAGDGDLIVDERSLAKGRLRIVGKFRGELPERIDLRLLEPDGSQHGLAVLVSKPNAALESSGEMPLAARQWARMKIDRLSGESARNSGEIRRLGLAFNLLTAETSLIVLDDVVDYVKYDIVPPASLRARFDELKSASLGIERKQANAHLDQIAAEYKDKVEWWKRDFPKTSDVQILAKDEGPAQAQVLARSVEQPAPMPAMTSAAPPPSPPADIAPREMVAGGADNAASSERSKKSDVSSDEGSAESEPVMRIGLKKWTPDAPYLARLNQASDADLYAIYIDQRADWINKTDAYFHTK